MNALLLAGGAAAVWFASMARGRRRPSAAPAPGGPVGPTAGRGWTAGSAVVLTPDLVRAVDRLRAEVGFDFVVNSGLRTPAAQAAAMATKVANKAAGDWRGELLDLYAQDDLVQDILAAVGTPAAPNTAAMADVLARQVAAGRYLSRHMRGDALDIRTRDLRPDQVAALVAAAKALGWDALVETNPPHLHLENVTS